MRHQLARLFSIACLALVAVLAALAPTPALAADGDVVLYRLYNPYTGAHHYTADSAEYDTLVAAGWDGEGEAWTSPASGDAVWRLYNPYTGDHHYTTDKSEYDALAAVGWDGEDVGWYSAPEDAGVPVWRLYNPYASVGTHHYTLDATERQTMLADGWVDEGVGWYALEADDGQAPNGMNTALDFFAYVGATEGGDHGTTASAIIDLNNPGGAKGWFVQGTGTVMDGHSFAEYTTIGSATDATAISNMYTALDVIEECNRLRAYEGLPELKVSDTAMAIGMLNANWTAAYDELTGTFDHASNNGQRYNWAENISLWYDIDGVFEGWFWQEKANYEGQPVTNPDTGTTYQPVPGGQVNHYLNITADYTIAGAGVTTSTGVPVYALEFKRSSAIELPTADGGSYVESIEEDELYTVDQYRARLDAAVAACR